MNKQILKQSLEVLSLEAEEQIRIFPSFVAITDELLLDFDDSYILAKGIYREFYSEEDIKILDEINSFIDTIPAADLNVTEIEELKTYDFWKQLRILSKEAILRLNWESIEK